MPTDLTIDSFAILALAVAALISVGARRAGVVLALAVIIAVQFGLAYFGILGQWNRTPPPMALMLLVCFAITVGFVYSPIGEEMAARLSFAALIGAQAFRVPLELWMQHASVERVIPKQMTYSGSNLDIISGLTAIVVAVVAVQGLAPRWLLIGWNALGSLLLLNVIVIAVRSMPMINAYGDYRMNTHVADAPFVWLPGVLVQAALLGHLLVWRKLKIDADIQDANLQTDARI
jgi:hypothetical protein